MDQDKTSEQDTAEIKPPAPDPEPPAPPAAPKPRLTVEQILIRILESMAQSLHSPISAEECREMLESLRGK